MEGFTYTNIFETKGIEYIIIIFFLLLLIPFWVIVNRKPIARQFVAAVRNFTTGMLQIPKGVYFSKNHTWAFLETNGEATTGVDDFLSLAVGNVKIKAFKKPGQTIKKGELMAELIAGEKKLNIISPLSGEIVQINPSATDNQDWHRTDFYRNAWFYKIKPVNWKEETTAFLLGDEAQEWIKNELHRLKDFLNVSTTRYSTETAPAVLQEGGELIVNPLEGMQREIWEDFQKEFLS